MDAQPGSPQEHWQAVYLDKAADRVSWYRPHLDQSLALLRQAGLGAGSRVVDVGGGASTLVDDLLAAGVRDITVLDLSAQALATARERLGTTADRVDWIVGDLLDMPLPHARFDLWHDRAVSHFISDDAMSDAYARQAAHAIAPGGHAIIAGFAPGGPHRCSGLPVVQRSAEDIARLLGARFTLVGAREERHVTPGGSVQAFGYAVLRRN
jgi:SAM-dependent methyltransferase